MTLTASPFDPTTGQLLPVYRDAYLRGDLARANASAVDAYLKKNSQLADETLRRFYEMKQQGELVRPVGWVQLQFDLLRAQPQRFRRRAAALISGAALLAGASMAATNLPDSSPANGEGNLTELSSPAVAASAATVRMVTVRGRILNENGQPLIGATVLDKVSHQGVGTDENGYYAMRLPAGQKTTLQYGYGGYVDDEQIVASSLTQNITLVPREKQRSDKKKHWLFF